MTTLPYPPNTHSNDHPHGEHVYLPPGASIAQRHQAAIDRFLQDATAYVFPSGHHLADLIDGAIVIADEDDYANNQVDLYTLILTPDVRPNDWPSVADVQSAVLVVINGLQLHAP